MSLVEVLRLLTDALGLICIGIAVVFLASIFMTKGRK